MSTTNLFVKLLVIGIGCAGLLTLLSVAALGYDSTLIRGLLSTPVPKALYDLAIQTGGVL